MRIILFVFFSLMLSYSSLFAQVSIPKAPPKYTPVNDFTNTLKDYEVAQLNQKLMGYEDSTSTQIAIVFIKSLQGSNLEEYAQTLAKSWGIGQKAKNNGLLILASLEEQKIRIQVGYGLEASIPDVAAQYIIDRQLSPNFRDKSYYEGLNQATDTLIKLAEGEFRADDLVQENRVIIYIILLVIVFLVQALFDISNLNFIVVILTQVFFTVVLTEMLLYYHWYGNLLMWAQAMTCIILRLFFVFLNIRLYHGVSFKKELLRDVKSKEANSGEFSWFMMFTLFENSEVNAFRDELKSDYFRLVRKAFFKSSEEMDKLKRHLIHQAQEKMRRPEKYFSFSQEGIHFMKEESENLLNDQVFWEKIYQESKKEEENKAIREKLRSEYENIVKEKDKPLKLFEFWEMMKALKKYPRGYLKYEKTNDSQNSTSSGNNNYSNSSGSSTNFGDSNDYGWNSGSGGSSGSDWGGGDFGGGGASGDW